MSLDELGKKLDNMGWELRYAQDPVDGSDIEVMDWTEVAGLVADYEDGLRVVWERGYNAGKLDEAFGARNHTNPYAKEDS